MKKEDTFTDLELTFQGDSNEEGGFEDIEIKFDGNSDEAMTMTAVDDTQVANELSVTDYMNDMIRLEKVNNGIMTFVLLLMIISSALKLFLSKKNMKKDIAYVYTIISAAIISIINSTSLTIAFGESGYGELIGNICYITVILLPIFIVLALSNIKKLKEKKVENPQENTQQEDEQQENEN